jgi:hypothetical protein
MQRETTYQTTREIRPYSPSPRANFEFRYIEPKHSTGVVCSLETNQH